MSKVIDKSKYLELVPNEWEKVKIEDLFKFSSGKSRPKDISKERKGSYQYPVYGGNGQLGFANEYSFENRMLILGRVGEYCGCAHLTEPQSWISDNALYTKEIYHEIDIEYFKHFFNYFDLNRFSNKNGQPLITQGNIGNLLIGKPDHSEQVKIRVVLSTLQKAIQKQNELLTLRKKDLSKSVYAASGVDNFFSWL